MAGGKWENQGAGKIQCKRFNDAWSKLSWEDKTYDELTGIIGGSERRMTYTQLVTGGGRADVAEARNRIGEKFGWIVTAKNVNEIIAMIESELPTLAKNRPVQDNRKTAAAADQEAADRKRLEEEHDRKSREERELFLTYYGNGDTITVQPGQMAVVAQICYNDSDSMTDYYSPHAGLGPAFALLVVHKQAETEALARRALATSQLLSYIDNWVWHVEKYSMGHGCYLDQDNGRAGFELPEELRGKRESYSNGAVTHGSWEIQFRHAYDTPVTLPCFRDYGSTAPAETTQPSTTAATGGVTVKENTEKNGVEIYFDAKPDATVISKLKANGWRWAHFNKCWYKKATDETRAFAKQFVSSAVCA